MQSIIILKENVMKNTFVFIDESGTKKQDRFFLVGFLRLTNPDKYFKTYSLYKDKLYGRSREERVKRVALLHDENKIHELALLAKNPSKFELKYSKINKDNQDIYKKLLETLCDIGFHFVVIGIDRRDPSFHDTSGLIASYKRIINQYLQKYGKKDDCILLDDFGIQIVNICEQKLLPDYFIRIRSESLIYMEIVDILTGLSGFAMHNWEVSKKDQVREGILRTFQAKLEKQIKVNQTIETEKIYYSTWVLNFSKGHGHYPNPLQ